MAVRDVRFVVTCEHGGSRIPSRYRVLFAGQGKVVTSHRGWDPGSMLLARRLARRLRAPLIASTTTRLLVDLNRSEDHRDLFSTFTRALSDAEKQDILERHYYPHRAAVTDAIDRSIKRGTQVVHIGVHSFVPELNGVVRDADIGLLYDPKRASELKQCAQWARKLAALAPQLRVRRNYPYRGNADGLTTALRARYKADRYAGIEVELNQGLLVDAARWRMAIEALCRVIEDSRQSSAR